jgi:hypothetical protein
MGYFSTVRWVSQGKRIGVWGTGEGERVGVLAYRRVGVGERERLGSWACWPAGVGKEGECVRVCRRLSVMIRFSGRASVWINPKRFGP